MSMQRLSLRISEKDSFEEETLFAILKILRKGGSVHPRLLSLSELSNGDDLPIRSSRRPGLRDPSRESRGREIKMEKINSNNDDYPNGIKLVAVIVALVLAVFIASLDMNIIATAIPRITDDFGSVNDIGWYGSALFLTVASSQSSWGKAYKYFDLKLVFLIAVAIFEVGSLICGVSSNSITLIVGRAIIGLGAAGLLAGCYIMIAFVVPPHRRPAFTGIIGATYGLASVLGPLLGGVFTDGPTWRWCFYINLPIGGVAAAIIIFTFKTPKASVINEARSASIREKLMHMDIIGSLLIMAGLSCLLLALQWGGVSKPWRSAAVIGSLIAFGVITIVFIGFEYWQGPRALLVPHVLRKREVWSGAMFEFFFGGGFFILLYYLPIYFQAVQGTSARQSGIRNLALIIADTIAVTATGIMITEIGYFAPFIVIGSTIATVGLSMIYTLSVDSGIGMWLSYQVIVGLGIGLCFQPPIMACQALAAPEDVSATTAVLLFFQTMGGAIFISAGQSAFSNQIISSLGKYTATAQLNPASVISVGATELRNIFGGAQLQAIILCYMDGLKVAFILSIALIGCALLSSAFVPWVSVKEKERQTTAVA